VPVEDLVLRREEDAVPGAVIAIQTFYLRLIDPARLRERQTPSYLHLPTIALAHARIAGPTITSM